MKIKEPRRYWGKSGFVIVLRIVLSLCAIAVMPQVFAVNSFSQDSAVGGNAQVPTIYATAWGVTLEQDGSGFYNEIAKDILKKADKVEAYQIMPYRRAKVSFFKAKDSCLYPSSLSGLVNAGQIMDPENYIESAGVLNARTHLFVQAGTKPPASLDDIAGKSIAYPNGSVAALFLEGHGATLISVNSEQDKAKMLINEHVDMITGMTPDTAIVFAGIGGDMPLYDPSLVLYEMAVTFICHKTPRNEQFIQAVNAGLKTLQKDNKYQARLATADLARNTLAEASGDTDPSTAETLDALTPSSGKKKRPPSNRSGRRLPVRQNH